MSLRSKAGLAAGWVLSLIAIASWASAQSRRQWNPVSEPMVIAGENLGFRVEWMHGDVPVGTLVVRVKGNWVTAEIGAPPIERAIPLPSPPPPR